MKEKPLSYINSSVVFTNGCFDVIHVGHIKLLEECSKLGRRVVVGLNSDSSIKRLKGKSRPVNNEKNRIKVLESIRFVDIVIVFEEDTPLNLIKLIRPLILVKGNEYIANKIVGAEYVKSYGGRVELIEMVPNSSSSRIIDARF